MFRNLNYKFFLNIAYRITQIYTSVTQQVIVPSMSREYDRYVGRYSTFPTGRMTKKNRVQF